MSNSIVVAGADGIHHALNIEGGLVGIRDRENPLYNPLVIVEVSDDKPIEIAPANDRRRALVICNTSDVIGYFSIGDGIGLTNTTYSFRLHSGETLVLSAPISIQPIYAICEYIYTQVEKELKTGLFHRMFRRIFKRKVIDNPQPNRNICYQDAI